MTPLEVHQLYKLRVDTYVFEQATPYQEIEDIDAADSTRHVLLQDESGALLGCARLHPAQVAGEEVTQFGRFVLVPSARGTGAGEELLRFALAEARADRPVYLTAQLGLTGYYARYGFTETGERYDDTGVPHQPMIRY